MSSSRWLYRLSQQSSTRFARRSKIIAATTLRGFASKNSSSNDETTKKPPSYSDTIMPGAPRHQYGSLGEAIPSPGMTASTKAWQAAHNSDVQRVTQKAMIYELIHEQTRTIESVIPWFLENMPET